MRWYPVQEAAVLVALNERYRQFHTGLGNDLSVGLRLGELLVRAGRENVYHQGRYTIVRPRPGMRPPPWAAREQMLAAGAITDSDIATWQASSSDLTAARRVCRCSCPLSPPPRESRPNPGTNWAGTEVSSGC